VIINVALCGQTLRQPRFIRSKHVQAALNCLLQRIGMTVSMPQIQAAFAPA
jgi:hypothetical protein